ncbi:MAG: GNAT family N-acetyltransferase [Candidatus Hodarchaeota archaeon]
MKKDKKWTVAPWYPLKDKNEMLELMKEYWGENEFTTAKFYDWQYLKNPAGEPVIILARDKNNGKLAGQYVVIAANITVAGQNLPATLSINTLTHKDYRGQGIFTELAEHVYKKCSEKKRYFTYGFPNENSYYGFINKLNFDDIGSVPLQIYLNLLHYVMVILLVIFVPLLKCYTKEVNYKNIIIISLIW